jgi:23S rRNA (guanosine2251-2'-O)-methyltransferase
MPEIILVVHNVRSAHNVGSLLRTADGLGVNQVIISGYSPYPPTKNDERLPHIAQKIQRQLQKTSLGAENSVNWRRAEDVQAILAELRTNSFVIVALEQTPQAISLNEYMPPEKIVLIVGNEVEGLDQKSLAVADVHLQIPMLGTKESFNVSVAGAMALYQIKYG